MRKLTAVLLALAVAATFAVGCSSDSGNGAKPAEEAKGPIVVGSKIDIEGPVLGQIMIKMLEAEGFRVEDRTRTGTTEVVRSALLAGEIDAYPEYTANALTVFYADQEIDPAILQDATATYEKAAELDLAGADIVWLAPAPANNTWAVAVPSAFAEENELKTLADWGAYIAGGGEVKVVGSQEFFERPDAMPGFEKAYGFMLKPAQKIILATGDTGVTEKAAAEGTDGANAGMAYGTDGTIAALDLFVLDDPKGVQPIYQPAPIFRKEVIDAYPEIADILDPVFARLDLATLQDLNKQVAVDGKDASVIAEEWLASQGFLK